MVLQLDSNSEFNVQLSVFEGPFDLLLNLIGRHELDITQISLSRVTDEFLSYLAAIESSLELEQASEFLVVAATLIDLKLASLLPSGEVVDSEDVAALEARDMLFARLLQYKAFKESAAWFDSRFSLESEMIARNVQLERIFRDIRPKLIWKTEVADLAAMAMLALLPKQLPQLSTEHLHVDKVSVRAEAANLIIILRAGSKSFQELIFDISRATAVARFLALLELYRENAISFRQDEPLGELICELGERRDLDTERIGGDYD